MLSCACFPLALAQPQLSDVHAAMLFCWTPHFSSGILVGVSPFQPWLGVLPLRSLNPCSPYLFNSVLCYLHWVGPPRERMDPEHLPSPSSPQLPNADPFSEQPVRFRVKRWASRVPRAEPCPMIPADACVAPSPKHPQPMTPPLRDHWFEGRMAPDYRPRRLMPSLGLGLPPPPVFRFQHHSVSFPVGGLAPHFPKLGILNPGMRPLVSLPVRPKVASPVTSTPLMVPVIDAAGTSAPVSGVRPSGEQAQTMLEMHDQLLRCAGCLLNSCKCLSNLRKLS